MIKLTARRLSLALTPGPRGDAYTLAILRATRGTHQAVGGEVLRGAWIAAQAGRTKLAGQLAASALRRLEREDYCHQCDRAPWECRCAN